MQVQDNLRDRIVSEASSAPNSSPLSPSQREPRETETVDGVTYINPVAVDGNSSDGHAWVGQDADDAKAAASAA